MIPKETIDDIFEACRIEEVVGDYVSLKKRGVNYIGNCPFHDEKTPSFTVSPAKGIYKCFGCGAGGNSINFVMDHEHFSYPEALKFLAKKYNIFIEEKELTTEELVQKTERESLYIVSNFANEYFIEQLQSGKGKAIGMAYFKERGFTDEIIEKFQLGYSPDTGDALIKAATERGYNIDFLLKTGLAKERDGRKFDGWRGRVMFPIQSLSGRTIGFGGRTLVTNNKKIPKYVNTPECDIYHKSKVLYGLNWAKNAIVKHDKCYLVEGYTDVISLHQVSIENVVASSGTSLTTEQIKLINRYTKNITILFDGDVAGIKASFRGINMILKEGMNVKVVLFPEGEDPDSYAKTLGRDGLQNYLEKNEKDFIVFKTDLLLAESEGDPIKKTKLVHEIVESVALIPDDIARSEYTKACANVLDVAETVLIQEVNKILRKSNQDPRSIADEGFVVPMGEPAPISKTEFKARDGEFQEGEIVRLLLNYGSEIINIEVEDENGEAADQHVRVSDYIVFEIMEDELVLDDPILTKIFNYYAEAFNEEKEISYNDFIHEAEAEVKKTVIDLISEKHELHNWKGRQIVVNTEATDLKRTCMGALYAFKARKLELMWEANQKRLKSMKGDESDLHKILREQMKLEELKQKFSKAQGRVIVR